MRVLAEAGTDTAVVDGGTATGLVTMEGISRALPSGGDERAMGALPGGKLTWDTGTDPEAMRG